ncbi:MAG: cytochrome C [Gammaproteobacteria bacterium]|nr:cytochrome C [Gammaproteobacteria bacterium]
MLAGMLLAGCKPETVSQAPSGNAERGMQAIRLSGCGSCHEIPGIDSADGRVGPPLTNLARRAYLAGILPNNFTNLVRWLQHPRDVAPETVMPDSGLDRAAAEDIAAYLYTMEGR